MGRYNWIRLNKTRIKYWILQYNKHTESGSIKLANLAKLHILLLVQAIIHDTGGAIWQKVPDKDRWIVGIGNTEGVGDTLLNAYLDAIFKESFQVDGYPEGLDS